MKEWNIENDGWLIFEERNEEWNEELTSFEGMNYWKGWISELIPNSFFFWRMKRMNYFFSEWWIQKILSQRMNDELGICEIWRNDKNSSLFEN